MAEVPKELEAKRHQSELIRLTPARSDASKKPLDALAERDKEKSRDDPKNQMSHQAE